MNPIVNRYRTLAAFVFLLSLALVSELHAQTVQLPSFSRFSYSGTVWVPVGGSTLLGGVSRSSQSVTRRPGAVTRGQQMNRGHASVHVTLIDNDAIDREIRGLPPRGSVGSSKTRSTIARSQTRRSSVDPEAEGKALVRFARRQYLDGNRMRSFEAYSMAIETLSPKLAALAKAERSRVFASVRPQ